MDGQMKFRIQIAGAVLLAGLALAQGTRAMQPAYESPLWIAILAAAAAYMVFEAWRTKRKIDETTNAKVTERKKQ